MSGTDDPRETPAKTLPMIRPADWDRFAEHAALVAIDVHLRSAQKQRGNWDRYVNRLADLHEQRRLQVEDGSWPGPTKETPDAT